MSIVRSDRFVARRRVALGLTLLLVPLVAGCPQEVPSAEPEGETPTAEQQSADEAPPFTSGEGVAESVPAEPGVEPTTPSRLPWESAGPSDPAPSDAGDLFADVGAPTERAPEKQDEAEEPEQEQEEDDGFGSFLSEAYGESPAGEEPPAEPEMSEPRAEEPSVTANEPQDEAPAETPSPEADDDWWAAAPAETTPEPPSVETPAAETTPAPKEPTAAASSDADLLDELWGDDTPAESDPPPPTPAEEGPKTEPTDADESLGLPFGDAAEEPAEEAEPAPMFDEPVSISEPEPEPLPEPKADTAPAVERPAPMAADAIKPLPAVPVLSFNTRHLAWLLGGKLGLAELADLDGATPQEIAEWRSEVERLAKSLKVSTPGGGDASPDSGARVRGMLDAASRAGAELTRSHGVDHAALMEIALKTNALLVIAKDRPDLAGSVARAVEEAADRAMLPKFLWEDAVRKLKENPTADETHDAVVQLHERVESFLR